MSILIKNCNLISVDSNRPKFEEGMDILIKENKIAKIKKGILETCDKIIDATNKVVIPGLINTHSHIAMSIFRETVDGYKTQDWLEKEIWPREDNLTPEDIYWASLLSCVEMIKTGCTTINDMYFFTDDSIRAVLETGVRLQTTRALVGQGEDDGGRISELENLINKYKEEPTITFNIGIHGMYTSDRAYVKKCVDFAEKMNLPIHMHFCENSKERADILRAYNVSTPAEVIKKDFKGIHNLLAHSVKVSNEDIKILKKTNSYISHCPVSNLKLGCGVAPISEMINQGLCVSLGTDGQGSGSNLDMFETMKFTALLQKGVEENPELMPAYEVIKMATINGAKALCMDNEIGSIEEGKLADLIILDLSDVVTQPINDIFSDIVYNAKGFNVNTTIINGKILMENKKLNNIDVNRIIKKCTSIFKK